MKLTSAGTALASLARETPDGPVLSRVIARTEGIPEKFLLKLLRPLAQAGLVRSRKGPKGGFALARDPKDVTLLDVVEAVDGPLRGEAPSLGKEGARLDKQLQTVCDRAAALVRERLGRVTLAELAKGT